MSRVQVIKYAVIYLDLLENDIQIVSVHNDIKDSLYQLNKTIDNNEEYNNTTYFKKYHDNQMCVSIFKTNYIMPKSLIGRYVIKQYDDCHDGVKVLTTPTKKE